MEDYEWDTDYQMGPETFLLQQRNADLAGRIRDYRRHLFGDSASYVEKGYLGAINRDVAVRERRRYTDLIRDDKDLAKAVNVLDKDMKHIQTGAVKRVRMTPVMAAPVPGPGGGELKNDSLYLISSHEISFFFKFARQFSNID